MSLLSIVIIIFVIAQFTPQGQEFLATRRGNALAVVIGVCAIVSMIPGLVLLSPISFVFTALWAYIIYPRWPEAQRFFSDAIKYRKLPR